PAQSATSGLIRDRWPLLATGLRSSQSLPRNRPIRTHAYPVIRAVSLALALAFASSGVASAEDAPAPPASAVDQLPPGQEVSSTVIELAGWVVAAKDNLGYPFAVIDKGAAQILVFGGDGRLRGAAPGLFGSAVGDHSAPGIAG